MTSSLRASDPVAKHPARLVVMCGLAIAIAVLVSSPAAAQTDPALAAAVAASHRSPQNVARDPHRHPLEVLSFFGVKPTDTVLEILPGSRGYYMEILAPYPREHGRYIAANRDS